VRKISATKPASNTPFPYQPPPSYMTAAMKASLRASQMSAMRRSVFARSWNGSADHAGKAACAASIARRMSAAEPSGTRA
jgi:predicted NAD/FAD-binding protein